MKIAIATGLSTKRDVQVNPKHVVQRSMFFEVTASSYLTITIFVL
jgi:hypothetical protein